MELIARQTVDFFFPGEIWIKWEAGIYVSSRRKTGGKTNFPDELRDAQILRGAGYTVYLVPEDTRSGKKQYDAIVDGMQMEFKNMKGKNRKTLVNHLIKSRKQAPNLFINLEKSPLSLKKVIKIIYRTLNSNDYINKLINHPVGIIILRLKGITRLIYINIDDLNSIKKPNT